MIMPIFLIKHPPTWPILPVLPTMLAMLTMLPASFCSFIKLAAVWVTKKVPFRLTSIT